MKLPNTAHTSRPWRIHELTPDFRLEDVWALPTPGGPGELPRLVAQFTSDNFPDGAPLLVRLLWAARWKIGALLGWDRPKAGLGARVKSLRNRLPSDLRDAPPPPDLEPFTPLYWTENEFAAEMANQTVHTVIHLGWVPDESGGYRGQMAALVKPNGLFGTAYMTAIKPLRHLLVYPALLRTIERGWQTKQLRRARDQAVPVIDRSLITLSHVDYLDLHTLDIADATTWSPEAWARAMFEDARPLRQRVPRLGLLGLLLSQPQPPGRVAGWVISEQGPNWLRMESRSRLTRDQVIVRIDGEGIGLVTAVHYVHRTGALLWPLIATQHRRLAPRVLRSAHDTLRNRDHGAVPC